MFVRLLAHFEASCIAFLAIATAAHAAPEVPTAWLHDAELTDVTFVDAEHGWAIGDRGVVWRTDDGGKVWHLVKSSVSCRLESVSFADAERGWIAGGDALPYVHTTRGVVLATTDGGRTWTNELRTDLPRIWKLQLHGENGWAFGEASALFGSGIFTTRDAGRSWSSAVPEEPLPAWTAADSPRPDFAALASANGVYATAPGGRAKLAAGPSLAVSRPRRIKFADETDGWLCGDNGLLLRTRDGGKTWQDMRDRLPERSGRLFDFHALDVRGRDIWLAGSPGTLVWRSTDDGETWTAHTTGQATPLKSIVFVDRHRGWAVGSFGRILATRDGGHTWRVQLGSAARAALVGVHATPSDIPLAAYAQSAGNDGYLAHAIVMHEPYTSHGRGAQDAASRRLHDALVAVGASNGETVSRFPIPDDAALWSTTALVEAWNQTRERGDADAMAQYEEYLVRQIRTWRPEAILTHDPANTDGNDSLRAFLATAVLNATQKAADPRAFPEHLAKAALQPWRVKRVFGALPAGESGPIELAPIKVASRLGLALGEAMRPASGLLSNSFSAIESTAFRTLIDNTPTTNGRRDFFSGAIGEETRDARRTMDVASPATLSNVQQRLIARRNAQGILTYATKNRANTLGWLGQLDSLAKGLDDESTAEIVRQLADRYEQQGEWEMAAEAHRVMTQRYAKSPLGPSSLAWLIAFESSDEIALRKRANPGHAVRQASAEEPATDAPNPNGAQVPASSNRRLGPLQKLIAQSDARMSAEAEFRFPLAAIERKAALLDQTASTATSPHAALVDVRLGDVWASLAFAEKWLTTRRGKPPIAVWQCKQVSEKPYLDGKLDDKLWQTATPIKLADGNGGEVRIARDDEFLYISGQFTLNTASPQQRPTKTTGIRDANLTNTDRFELTIDVDRDYVTAFTLAVDPTGRTNDRIGRDTAWNPEWFVATREQSNSWTLEAAIPLAELNRNSPTRESPWAIALRLHTPGIGTRSATTDASTELNAASFGWLDFE